jgi:hypothetical protein
MERLPDTLTSMNNLALLLKDQGKLEEAEPLHRADLEGRREVLGERHRDTLVSTGNYTDLLRQMGRLAEARSVLGDAVAVAEEVWEARHEDTLIIRAMAARLLSAEGDVQGTEGLAQVVAVMEEVLGLDNPQTHKYAAALGELRAGGAHAVS